MRIDVGHYLINPNILELQFVTTPSLLVSPEAIGKVMLS